MNKNHLLVSICVFFGTLLVLFTLLTIGDYYLDHDRGIYSSWAWYKVIQIDILSRLGVSTLGSLFVWSKIMQSVDKEGVV